jgi:hypothetical protein
VKPKEAKQAIVVSDTHCASTLGLCSPNGHKLDDGGMYKPSRLQKKVWGIWEEFWGDWVPKVTKGEPYDLIINGDAIDGDHHNTTTIISRNLHDQYRAAKDCLEPQVARCLGSGGRYYHVRGTEAHVGQSAQEEERLAEALGAVPDEEGNYSRWELWKRIGGALTHFTHHIGTTGSQAYESTALMREMVEAFVESGRWGDTPPQVVVRSHRHRCMSITIPTKEGYGIVTVSPGWQLKTPYTFKIAGARVGQPQFGGLLIRAGHEELHSRFFVRRIERSKEE